MLHASWWTYTIVPSTFKEFILLLALGIGESRIALSLTLINRRKKTQFFQVTGIHLMEFLKSTMQHINRLIIIFVQDQDPSSCGNSY